MAVRFGPLLNANPLPAAVCYCLLQARGPVDKRWFRDHGIPMLVMLLPSVTLVRLAQESKASLWMVLTLLGIVTLLRLVHPANA